MSGNGVSSIVVLACRSSVLSAVWVRACLLIWHPVDSSDCRSRGPTLSSLSRQLLYSSALISVCTGTLHGVVALIEFECVKLTLFMAVSNVFFYHTIPRRALTPVTPVSDMYQLLCLA